MAFEMRPLNYRDVRYVVEHIRDADLAEINACRWNDSRTSLVDEVLHHWGTENSVSWVAVLDGEPIACIGAVQVWPKSWSAWMFATDNFYKIRKSLTKFVIQEMVGEIRKRGGWRCDARSINTHTKAHQWMQAVGAEYESRLEKYGKNGEDFVVYRWI